MGLLGALTFKICYEFLNLLALGGGEAVGEVVEFGVEVSGYAVGGRRFYSVLDKSEDLNAHKVGSFKAKGRECGVEGVELDVVCAVVHLFDEGLVAVYEDDGDAAVIHA